MAINPQQRPSATTSTTGAGTKQLRFLVIGAGSRGHRYAEAVTETTSALIHAVAEPRPYNRQEFGERFIWGTGSSNDKSHHEGQEFSDWRQWLKWEQERRSRLARNEENVPLGVDGVFVCALDEMHVEIMCAIAPLNLHVLCEKPLATSLQDCLAIYRAFVHEGKEDSAPSKVFSIGHVLRYSPHNMRLRQLLLEDRVIGDVVSVEHVEPVGYWHFSHSYVRGNWRRETAAGVGSLLTKSCHDIDFLVWLLSSPPPGPAYKNIPPHHPRTISSTGKLTQFLQKRKPKEAGNATNCLSCPIERKCDYSSIRLYKERQLDKGQTDWPLDIVCPDIEDTFKTAGVEAAQNLLRAALAEDYDRNTATDAQIASRAWYGRCVWESDNNVCDDQFVTITWDDEEPGPQQQGDGGQNGGSPSYPLRTSKTASLHMIAPTEKQCERRGRIYGTKGEIEYDSRTIRYFTFATNEFTTIEIPKAKNPKEEKAHGGGDWGLTRMFIGAVQAVEEQGWDVKDAQREFIGCTLEEAVRSHAVVFAAEEARREEKVIRWQDWWEEHMKSKF